MHAMGKETYLEKVRPEIQLLSTGFQTNRTTNSMMYNIVIPSSIFKYFVKKLHCWCSNYFGYKYIWNMVTYDNSSSLHYLIVSKKCS